MVGEGRNEGALKMPQTALLDQKAYLTCLNPERLGLLTLLGGRPPSNHPLPFVFDQSHAHQDFRVSEFGIAFCDACRYDKDEF